MPPARNQEVTVRRPLAKRMPQISRGRRAAERLCSQWARPTKALARNGGRCENGMVGSWTRDSLHKGHRVQRAGVRPPTCRIQNQSPGGNRSGWRFPRGADPFELRAKYRTFMTAESRTHAELTQEVAELRLRLE